MSPDRRKDIKNDLLDLAFIAGCIALLVWGSWFFA